MIEKCEVMTCECAFLVSVLTFMCVYACVSAHMCAFINLLPPSLPYVSEVPGATLDKQALTSQDMAPNTHYNTHKQQH